VLCLGPHRTPLATQRQGWAQGGEGARCAERQRGAGRLRPCRAPHARPPDHL